MKKKIIIGGIGVCLCAVLVVLAVFLDGKNPVVALQEGMTRVEVQKVFGKPDSSAYGSELFANNDEYYGQIFLGEKARLLKVYYDPDGRYIDNAVIYWDFQTFEECEPFYEKVVGRCTNEYGEPTESTYSTAVWELGDLENGRFKYECSWSPGTVKFILSDFRRG